MEKTYYKGLVITDIGGSYEATFEMSDHPEGFFMPVVLGGSTEELVMESVNKFLGENSIDLNSKK